MHSKQFSHMNHNITNKRSQTTQVQSNGNILKPAPCHRITAIGSNLVILLPQPQKPSYFEHEPP